jgi:hypothetical protein
MTSETFNHPDRRYYEFGGFTIDMAKDKRSLYYKQHIKVAQNQQQCMRCWYE